MNDGTTVVEPAPTGFYGFPKRYEITGDQISISPITLFNEVEGDELFLDYYRKPETASTEALSLDVIPDRLFPFVVRATLARLKVYHEKMDQAQFHMQDAGRAAQAFTEENKPADEPR